MGHIDLYYTSIHDWDTEFLLRRLSKKDATLCNAICHESTRKRKITNRGVLSLILTNYYGLNSDQLVYIYNQRGKPRLKASCQLHFNISHSHDLVIIGVSSDSPIGVDVEKIQPLSDEQAVAKYFFEHKEYAAYLELKRTHTDAFYRFWTAKEAAIKACGKGLWEAKNAPQIYLQNQVLMLKQLDALNSVWSLMHIDIIPTYLACVASEEKKISTKVSYVTEKILAPS